MQKLSIMNLDYWTHWYLSQSKQERQQISRTFVQADTVVYAIGFFALIGFLIVGLVKGWF